MGRRLNRILGNHMDPEDAVIEMFFGLIMALDVSNILRLALIGQPDGTVMATLVVAVIGCNIAWGMADGLMNALSRHYDDIKQYKFVQMLKTSPSLEEASKRAMDAIRQDDDLIGGQTVDEAGLDVIGRELARCAMKEELVVPHLRREGAMIMIITIFLNVVAALPILGIYLLFTDYFGVNLATLFSNLAGIGLLFYAGYTIDRKIGNHRYYAGMLMAIMGLVLLAIIIALGG